MPYTSVYTIHYMYNNKLHIVVYTIVGVSVFSTLADIQYLQQEECQQLQLMRRKVLLYENSSHYENMFLSVPSYLACYI